MNNYDWDKYQAEAMSFAIYKNKDYPHVALLEELGELAGKIAKPMRGDKKVDVPGLLLEIGDVLWCLAAALHERGEPMVRLGDESSVPYVRGASIMRPSDVIILTFSYAMDGDRLNALCGLAGLAKHYGSSLESCATANLAKLRSRKERGVIKGDGDNR